jgi:cephalosporin hydroxylase
MDLLEKSFQTNYTTFHGWCTVEKARKIIELVGIMKPDLCVELGVYAGRSLLPLAVSAKHHNPNARVVGIDAWSKDASLEGENSKENDDWWSKIDYNYFMSYTSDLLKLFQAQSITELWKARSVDVSHKFEDESIDILHQDSNHSEKVSCDEVELYWNKVKKGGYWIFDDTNWETTKKAQDLLVGFGYTEIYSAPKNEWKVFQRDQ